MYGNVFCIISRCKWNSIEIACNEEGFRARFKRLGSIRSRRLAVERRTKRGFRRLSYRETMSVCQCQWKPSHWVCRLRFNGKRDDFAARWETWSFSENPSSDGRGGFSKLDLTFSKSVDTDKFYYQKKKKNNEKWKISRSIPPSPLNRFLSL